MSEDLNWFQKGIKSFTGAGPNEGYFPDNQGLIPDKWTGGTPTKEALGNAGNYVIDQGRNAGNYVMNKGQDAYNYMTTPASISDFDMNDKESVIALQEKLGVTADGMFGPETEKAYRLAVDKERTGAGEDSLKYDYNDNVQAEKKFQPFGGMFRKAYSNMDKGVFGGKLPGGYSEDNVQTAEDYYNK